MYWVKEKLKRFKKWIIVFIVGGIALAGAVDYSVVTNTEFISAVSTKQEAYKQIYGKYRQMKRSENWGMRLPKNEQIEIDEYVTPKGESGYVVFLEYEKNGQHIEKSINVGPEIWRNKIYVESIFVNSTSTP